MCTAPTSDNNKRPQTTVSSHERQPKRVMFVTPDKAKFGSEFLGVSVHCGKERKEGTGGGALLHK